jgi:4-amino-4-deoxy-L-arabinose transferase-like glycosyltransferase
MARAVGNERRYWLGWLVILLAIAARVGWAAWVAHAHPAAVTSGDTAGYLGPARALLDNGHFDISPQNDTPMFLRTPGYPVLLAAILWVTDSVWSISPIQAALSLGTVLMVVYVGRRTIGGTASMVAGVIVALDPLQFALSGTILTESLASFMLIAVVAAAVPVFATTREQVTLRSVAVLGVVLAVATLVRPTTYYFPIVVVVLIAVRCFRLPKGSLVALLAVFAVSVVVVTGAWNLRNHDAIGSWQISGSPAVTLYCWHGAAVDAKVAGTSIAAARQQLGCPPGGWDDLETACPPFWDCDVPRPLADGASWDEMNDRGIEILTDHPVDTAEVMARGFVREIVGPGTDTVGRFLHVGSSPVLVAALMLWNSLLWVFAVVGAFVGLRSRQRWFWGFVVTAIVYLLIVSAGANSGARFRTPLVPLLALLAALGVRHLVRALRDRDRQAHAQDAEQQSATMFTRA